MKIFNLGLSMITAFFYSTSVGAQTNPVAEAAARLKSSKVERTWNDCMKLSGSREDVCRALLDADHAREKDATLAISRALQNPAINQAYLQKEYMRCQHSAFAYTAHTWCIAMLQERLSDAERGQTLRSDVASPAK